MGHKIYTREHSEAYMADFTTMLKLCLLSSENVLSFVEKDVGSILEDLDLQLLHDSDGLG